MKTIIAVVATALITTATATAVGGLVTTEQIKNGTIRLIDLHPSVRVALRGQPGARGEQGTQGVQGPAGPAGGFDLTKVQQVRGPSNPVLPGSITSNSVAQCPPGTILIGGGGNTSGPGTWVSQPASSTSWIYGSNSYTYTSATVTAYAICTSS